MSKRYLSPKREAEFPNLTRRDYHVTSDETSGYNCIAHAAARDDSWWWPADFEWVFWPDNVPKEETLEAFIQAYGTLGYVVCGDGVLEAGFEKVALFVEADGSTPSHAARQLPSGKWTSKLGEWEDVEHYSLPPLEDRRFGMGYGTVAKFLKRPRRDD